mmetsp:Transcript_22417/g.53794  ORF Transcript_22417/g.53794 Transcript_22417/m.53794 type:complete len:211 (+) Transcript_22417:699-1331(+)
MRRSTAAGQKNTRRRWRRGSACTTSSLSSKETSACSSACARRSRTKRARGSRTRCSSRMSDQTWRRTPSRSTMRPRAPKRFSSGMRRLGVRRSRRRCSRRLRRWSRPFWTGTTCVYSPTARLGPARPTPWRAPTPKRASTRARWNECSSSSEKSPETTHTRWNSRCWRSTMRISRTCSTPRPARSARCGRARRATSCRTSNSSRSRTSRR